MQPRGGFSHPERVIDELNITGGSRVADFGSGSGYFALYCARAVGPEGSVSAIDVLPEKLALLKSRAHDEGLENIFYIHANLETLGSSRLADSSQDVVLLANILFQSRQKDAIVEEAARVAKPNGMIVMIDWIPNAPFGSSEPGLKFSADEGRLIGERHGLKFERSLHPSTNHWGILFRK